MIIEYRALGPCIRGRQELQLTLQRRRSLESFLGSRAESAARLTRVPPQHGRLPNIWTIHFEPGIRIRIAGNIIQSRVLPMQVRCNRSILGKMRSERRLIAAKCEDERARVCAQITHLTIE